MKARIAYLLVIVSIIALTAELYAGKKDVSQADVEKWEYEVMSALINYYYGSDFELLLIDDHTEAWCIRARLKELRSEWVELKPETIDSLITRNGFSVPIERKLSLDAKYRLMSRGSYHEVLQAGNGPNWDNFDSVYPDTPGFLTISRPAFDSRYSQALIYFGNAYRCREMRSIPKDRSIAFFVRKDDAWLLRGIKKGFQSFYYE
jgi:hypothetical protein